MMKGSRHLVIGAAVAAMMAAGAVTTIAADEAPKADAKPQKAGKGTEDKNVAGETTTNAGAGQGPAAPAVKGGDKTRASCAVHVNNHTDLIVKFFVDGSYRGTVSPWGDIYGYESSGAHVLYARADYTDGTYDWWGPNKIVCKGSYEWGLYGD